MADELVGLLVDRADSYTRVGLCAKSDSQSDTGVPPWIL